MTAQVKPLLITGDATGKNTFSIGASAFRCAYVLTANTAKTINVPSGANHVSFSCDGNFYFTDSGTAVVPSADITDGTAPEINPASRCVTGITTLSVIAPANAVLTCRFES